MVEESLFNTVKRNEVLIVKESHFLHKGTSTGYLSGLRKKVHIKLNMIWNEYNLST